MSKSEIDKLRTEVFVKLTMLIGACRTKSITKAQIEQSLEQFRNKLEADSKPKCPASRKGGDE